MNVEVHFMHMYKRSMPCASGHGPMCNTQALGPQEGLLCLPNYNAPSTIGDYMLTTYTR